MNLDQELIELLAELRLPMPNKLELEAGADNKDPGPDEYDFKREAEKRKLMQQMAFYAEEGPTWDPEGKYLCGSCYFRQLMDWGDSPACYIVEGKISMEAGSCQFYRHGNPDSEWNPIPLKEKYTKEAANYAERPKVKGFGCYPRCEYGGVAEGQDKDGREIWCGQFGVHVRAKACCAFEDGKDLVQISAGGPGSGCNPEAGKCGRPEGEHLADTSAFYMHEKIGGAQGTNPGGMYKGKDGVYRYVKLYSDPKQARGEFLANKIYTALGKNVPQSTLFTKDGGHVIANTQLQGKTFSQMGNFSQEQAIAVLDGFAADVLTANWDAVGTGLDNVFVDNKGTVYRLDQGGTFLKRAKGGDKPEAVLNQITEVNGLLDKSKNPYYSQVAEKAGVKSVSDLGDKTDTESFKDQVGLITALRDQAGGWQKYVSDTVPDMPKAEQQKIAGMLDARTNLMENLVKEQENPKVPDSTKTPAAQPTDTPKEGGSKWRQYNPNLVGGYFRQGTAIATIYNSLTKTEGQWQSVSQIKKSLEGKSTANIDNRFTELKYTGKRSGRWSIEISGDNVRIFLQKVSTTAPLDVVEDKQKLAQQFAQKMMSMKGNMSPAQSASEHASFYQQMGVSMASKQALESAVKSWTGTNNGPEAQNWRQVAMEYYHRTPDQDYTGYNKKVMGTPEGNKRANDMRAAAMALKAYSSEFARINKVNVVYRNIGDDQAKDIVKAMRLAESQGKTKIAIANNSLSCWSDKPNLSLNNDVKIRMKIDPDNVWAVHEASPHLFTAHSSEHEYMIGMHNPVEIFDFKDISINDQHEAGATAAEMQKWSKKFMAAKDELDPKADPGWYKAVKMGTKPLPNSDDVCWDIIVGPLDDHWMYDKNEK